MWHVSPEGPVQQGEPLSSGGRNVGVGYLLRWGAHAGVIPRGGLLLIEHMPDSAVGSHLLGLARNSFTPHAAPCANPPRWGGRLIRDSFTPRA